ncbi:unnamed protein product, partial [Polarella glacialis]
MFCVLLRPMFSMSLRLPLFCNYKAVESPVVGDTWLVAGRELEATAPIAHSGAASSPSASAVFHHIHRFQHQFWTEALSSAVLLHFQQSYSKISGLPSMQRPRQTAFRNGQRR